MSDFVLMEMQMFRGVARQLALCIFGPRPPRRMRHPVSIERSDVARRCVITSTRVYVRASTSAFVCACVMARMGARACACAFVNKLRRHVRARACARARVFARIQGGGRHLFIGVFKSFTIFPRVARTLSASVSRARYFQIVFVSPNAFL